MEPKNAEEMGLVERFNEACVTWMEGAPGCRRIEVGVEGEGVRLKIGRYGEEWEVGVDREDWMEFMRGVLGERGI